VVNFDTGLAQGRNAPPKRNLIKKNFIKLMAPAIKLFRVRDRLPTVCVFGLGDLKLITPVQEDLRPLAEEKQAIRMNIGMVTRA